MAGHFFPLTDRREVAEGTMAFRFETSGSDFALVHYMAGPPGMVEALKELLLGRGVSRDNVRFGTFSGY